MNLKKTLVVLAMGALSLFGTGANTAYAQEKICQCSTADMRDSTSEAILQDCGPRTGLMLVLYTQADDLRANDEETTICRVVGSNPKWLNSIRLRKVDVQTDSDRNSGVAQTPALVMTVTGADGKLRVVNVATFYVMSPEIMADFIAQGIETMNHPPRIANHREMQESSLDEMFHTTPCMEKREALVLKYSSKSYLSMAFKCLVERAISEIDTSDYALVSVDVADSNEDDNLGQKPILVHYQRDDRGRMIPTDILKGFQDLSCIEGWLLNLSKPLDPTNPDGQ